MLSRKVVTSHLQTYGTFSGNSDKGDIDSSEDENSEGSTREQDDADLLMPFLYRCSLHRVITIIRSL